MHKSLYLVGGIYPKMDLNSFLGNNTKKTPYKIMFEMDGEKIIRFPYGTSKENAKHNLEEELKKEYPKKKYKIIQIKELRNN